MTSIELTPIELHNNIWLKRDDLYTLRDANGGKLRQVQEIIKHNLVAIKEKHNNIVVGSFSINSFYSPILATVCKENDIICEIVTYNTKKYNRSIMAAKNEGAVMIYANAGYPSVINYVAKQECLVCGGLYFNDYLYSDASLNALMEQVQNIPADLDYLVIPVGGAVNCVGILRGIEKCNLKIKKIYGISVGYDILDFMKLNAPPAIPIEIIKYNLPYNKKVRDYYIGVDDSEELDASYEGKAYDWIIKNLNVIDNKVLLWIVGRSLR